MFSERCSNKTRLIKSSNNISIANKLQNGTSINNQTILLPTSFDTNYIKSTIDIKFIPLDITSYGEQTTRQEPGRVASSSQTVFINVRDG